MTRTEIVANAAIACVALVGYIVLVALGHDANPLLAWLGGQGSAVAVRALASPRSAGGSP